MKKYWSIKDNLSVDNDLIVYGCRLYVPHSLRATMLSQLHEGIARSQARACLTIYWPGIDGDIENYVKGCRHCQDRLPLTWDETRQRKSSPTSYEINFVILQYRMCYGLMAQFTSSNCQLSRQLGHIPHHIVTPLPTEQWTSQ